jgi:uncharacterized protein
VNNFLSFLVRLLFLGPVLFAVSACSPVSPPVAYHSLVDLGPAHQRTGPPSPLVILVGPVSTPDILKQSQISTGSTDDRYLLNDQHRWAGEVSHQFSRAMAELLADKLGTEDVVLFPKGQDLEPTHQITFDILALDGILGEDANLMVRWSLIDPKGKAVRLTRRSSFSEKPANGSYDAWVSAQRSNVRRLSEEIAAAIKAAH